MAEQTMDLSLRSIKTNITFEERVTSMSCTLDPPIQSGDTGQWIIFLTAVN